MNYAGLYNGQLVIGSWDVLTLFEYYIFIKLFYSVMENLCFGEVVRVFIDDI